jgi:serine/threonine protein kinase
VLVTEEGHLKVADFGLATKSSNDLGQPFRNKTLCGTPEYMAPEMIKEAGHGTMVDVWALGCMAYEFLEGKPPFTGAMQEMFVGVLAGKPAFSTSASRTVMDLIHALLHKEPSQRLGANGMDEIKSHAFFRGVDWAAVERQEVRPPMRPRTVGGEDQVEAAALMARIRSDFKPYASPVHSPTAGAPTMGRSPLCNRVSTRFDSPKHDTSPQSISADLEEDTGFPPNKSICVVCSDTHKILQRDSNLSQLTGLPFSRTNALLDEMMASKEDADIVQKAIMRVLLMSAGDTEHTESVRAHLTPMDTAGSSQVAAIDIRRSRSTKHAAVLRITLASM